MTRRIRHLTKSSGVLAELRQIYRENRYGDLSNDDARTLMQLLKTMDGIIQTSDIETRLEVLERQDSAKKSPYYFLIINYFDKLWHN